MLRRILGCLAMLGFLVACGTSVDAGGLGPGSVGSTGGSGGSGGLSTGGAGNGGSTGGAGTGGSAGAGGLPASTCVEPDYCSCAANQACNVVAEDCFCPCGVEPCEPSCD